MKLKIWTTVLVMSLLMINGLYVVNGSIEKDNIDPLKRLKPIEKTETNYGNGYSTIHHHFNLTLDSDNPPKAMDLVLNYSSDDQPTLKLKCYRPDDLGSEGSILIFDRSGLADASYFPIFQGQTIRETIYQALYQYETESPNISARDVNPGASLFGKNDGKILSDPNPLKGEYRFEMTLMGKNVEIHESTLICKAGNYAREADRPDEGLVTETVVEKTSHSTYPYMNFDIKIDHDGDPHIIYKEPTTSTLKYKFWTENGWEEEEVTSSNSVSIGQYALSIAIGDDGDPHIVYDKDSSMLRYGHKEDRSWDLETIDQEQYIGQYPKLSISPEGTPRLMYGSYKEKTLIYAVKENEQWEKKTIAHRAVTYDQDIAFDNDGDPHVLYVSEVDSSLQYLYREDGEWKSESPTMFGMNPEEPMIDVDKEGNIYVAFRSQGLIFGKKEGDDWSFDMVCSYGEPSHLEVDDKGDPHLIYKEGTNDSWIYSESYTKHWMKVDGEWQTEKLGRGFGYFQKSDIDRNGNPHVFYENHTEDDLKLEYTRIEGTKGAYRDESSGLLSGQMLLLISLIALIAVLVVLFAYVRKKPPEKRSYREEEHF